MKKNILLVIGILFLLLIFLNGTSFVLSFDPNGNYNWRKPKNTPTPTITPTPTVSPTPTPTHSPMPIPHGRTTFTVGGGSQGGPTVYRGALDPYDPMEGTVQKIQAVISNVQTDQIVTVTVKTDHNSRTLPMSIVTVGASNNTWEASWTVDDTYLYTYKAIIEAVGSAGKTVIDITLR